MKLLKRLILFTLASEQDFFVKSDGYGYCAYGYLYSRLLSYHESSIRDAVLQLVRSQDIDKIVRNAVPLFRLTARGRDRLLSFYIISIGQKKVWDGIWRIALLEPAAISHQSSAINHQPSKDLNELRKLKRGLMKMGFKQFSRGIYLSALPISAKLREYLLGIKAGTQITVIESRRILVGDNRQLAERFWQLNLLDEAYRNLISQINDLLIKIKIKKVLDNQVKKDLSAIYQNYFNLLEKDPGLPKKLLHTDWPLDLAKESFLKLVSKIKALESNIAP